MALPLALSLGATIPARADVFFGTDTKITASDASASDQFGIAVAIDGNSAVVGANNELNGGIRAGAAYVFNRVGGVWGQVKRLQASDRQTGDEFGYAVGISTNTVVVGAPFEDEGGSAAGAAYVFERNEGGADNWGQVAKLVPAAGASGDEFGFAVSVWGDTIVVGAHFNDAKGTHAGAAYIFQRTGPSTNPWEEVTQMVATDGFSNDELSYAVAIHEDTVVLGAPGETSSKGAVYVFGRNQGGADNWGQVRKVVASGEIGADRYGSSVDLHADRAAVGAPQEDQNGSDAGAAYVIERNQGGANNWGQVRKLVASDGASSDLFGTTVSVFDDVVLVGAPENDGAASLAGAAYVYQKNATGAGAWGETDKAVPTDASGLSFDEFGTSVALGSGTALIGRPLDDSPSSNAGSAYFFDLDFNFAPVVNNQVFPVLENSPSDTLVGTVAFTDSDGGDSHTFLITAGNSAGAFNIDSDNGEIRVANATLLDHEALPQVVLTVQVTDDGTPPLFDTGLMTINITDDASEIADLELVKTAPATAKAGNMLAYTLVVTNHGPNTANAVALSDTLPGDVTPTGVKNYNLGTLAAGASASVVINVTIDNDFEGALINMASVTSQITDGNTPNNAAAATTTVTRVADMKVDTFVASTLTTTNRLVYTIQVKNLGPSRADGIAMTNFPGPGATFDPTGSSIVCSGVFDSVECDVGALNPGQLTMFTIAVIVDDTFAGSLINYTAVGAPYADPVLANNISTGITEVTDFDMDGLPDFSDPDDDNDLMPDDWELMFGLNPTNAADAVLNLDGDPSLNVQEYIADTDPMDSNAYFRIEAVTNGIEVIFLSSTGRVYTLQSTDNLTAGFWTQVSGQIDVPGAGGLDSLSDTNTIGAEAYRVGVEVP